MAANNLNYHNDDRNQGWIDNGNALTSNFEGFNRFINNAGQHVGAKPPKVAIPSPFARFALVEQAFKNYAANQQNCEQKDLRLISNTLDLLQLIYENNNLTILQTNIQNIAEYLQNNNLQQGNVLLGDALKMFSRQENYGFQNNDQQNNAQQNNAQNNDSNFCVFSYNNCTLGCSSPTSIVLATPNTDNLNIPIRINGDRQLFSNNYLMLEQRDVEFIKYVYRIVNQFNNNQIETFKDYLKKVRERVNDVGFQDIFATNEGINLSNDEILNWRNNYAVYDNAQSFGGNLYHITQAKAKEHIQNESGLILNCANNNGVRYIEGTTPMILSNNCPTDLYNYSSNKVRWNKTQHKVDYDAVRGNNRDELPLPGTTIKYPWLCEDDLLSDVLIQVPYKFDSKNFVSGEVNLDSDGFFLPLKPDFFKYFSTDFLQQNNLIFKVKTKREGQGNQQRTIIESVEVLLNVPIKAGIIQLKKTYYAPDANTDAFNTSRMKKDMAEGYILEYPLALSIFPFVRSNENNIYRIMLRHEGGNKRIALEAKTNGDQNVQFDGQINTRDTSQLYSLKNSVDYFIITLSHGQISHHAVCVPKWPQENGNDPQNNGDNQQQGGTICNFAFDFGTSNSYIAVMTEHQGDNGNQIGELTDIKLVSTISPDNNNNETGFKILNLGFKQHFIPLNGIGDIYKFPLSTVLSLPENLNLGQIPDGLKTVNIPFIYGKEDYGADNIIASNFKWYSRQNKNQQQKLANAFIEEMFLLCRAYALAHHADLSQTKMVWTYPLSMKDPSGMHAYTWQKYYKDYFFQTNDNEHLSSHVKRISESIAPVLYYTQNNRNRNAEASVSIDIGGGTCDVVLNGGNQGSRQEQIKITSFRFAGDIIFNPEGVNASQNKMVQKMYNDFVTNLNLEQYDGNFFNLLKRVCTGNSPSSEANSLLFALETLPSLSYINHVEDKSYNIKLKQNEEFKIIFIYFYAAIIYYLAILIKKINFPQPATLYFSGMGSKLLNIIGNAEQLQNLTTTLLKTFGDFDYNNPINISIEAEKPKKITAEGALTTIMANPQPATQDIIDQFANNQKVNNATVFYSLVGDINITNSNRNDKDLIKGIIDIIASDFNPKFVDITKLDFVQNNCSKESISRLSNLFNNKVLLHTYLQSEINNFPIEDNEENETLKECLFFYPIKNIISEFLTIRN